MRASSRRRPSSPRPRGPTRSELASPSAGAGLTTRRSPAPGDGRLDLRRRRRRGRRPTSPSPAAARPRRARAGGSGGRRAGRAACRRRTATRPRRRARRRSPVVIRARRPSPTGTAVALASLVARGRARASAARAAVPFRDDLGEDRERRLGRQPPAEVQPDRAAQPVELGRAARRRLEQPRPTIGLGLPRADRADVAAAAVERLDDRRLVELHVVGEHRHRVGRPEPDLVGDLVRPADDQPVDVREALRASRTPPGRRSRRSRSRAPSRAGRASARPRPRRRRRAAAGPGTPRRTAAARRARPSARCRGGAHRAPASTSAASSAGSPSEPSSRPSSCDDERRPGRLARARARAARTPPAASRGSGVTIARPCPPVAASRGRVDAPAGTAGSTRTSIVPPQARPDVPRLLVADPVADHPR